MFARWKTVAPITESRERSRLPPPDLEVLLALEKSIRLKRVDLGCLNDVT
jgi:hypothetical protein